MQDPLEIFRGASELPLLKSRLTGAKRVFDLLVGGLGYGRANRYRYEEKDRAARNGAMMLQKLNRNANWMLRGRLYCPVT